MRMQSSVIMEARNRARVKLVCPGSAARLRSRPVPLRPAVTPRPARTERMPAMLWPGLVRRFPVLAIRDFRLLLADRVLAPAAAAFSLVGVAFAVLEVTGSTADLSYVLAAQILPSLVFALAGGVVADRIAPQRVIVAANLMIAVGEGGFGLLVLTGHPQLWQMIALETLNGAGMAVFYPASQALRARLGAGHLRDRHAGHGAAAAGHPGTGGGAHRALQPAPRPARGLVGVRLP